MLLHRLVLRNFKRYRDEEIRFCDGITGIVGNNGAGKSSLTDAILFALYGVQGGVDAEYVVSSFAGPKDRCEVRLEFAAAGEEYVVQRTFRKTANSTQHKASLFMLGGEKQLAEGVSAVASEVQRVLGMGPSDFRSTVFAAQKDLLALLDERPAARKEWFMKMLGIDYLKEEGQAVLKAELEGVEHEIGRGGGALSVLDEDRVQEALEACRAEVARTGEQVEACHKSLSSLDVEAQEIEAERETLEAAEREVIRLSETEATCRREIDRLRFESTSLEGEIEAVSKNLRDYDALATSEKEYEGIVSTYDEWRGQKHEHDLLVERRASLHAEKAREVERLDALSATLARLDVDAARCRELKPSVRRREEVRGEQEVLKAEEEQHRHLCESLRTAEQHFSGIERRTAALSREVAALRQKDAERSGFEPEVARYDDCRRLKEVLDEAAGHHREALRLREEARSVRNECAAQEDVIRGLRRDAEGLGDPVAALEEAERKRATLASSLVATKAGREAAANRAVSAREHLQEIEALGPDSLCPTCHQPLRTHYPDLVADLEEEATAAEREVGALDDGIAGIERERAAVEEDIAGIAERCRTLQELQARIAAREESLAEQGHRCDLLTAGYETEEEKIAVLGIGAYDPGRHEEIVRELAFLSELKVRYDRLAGETAAMPEKIEALDALDAEGSVALLAVEVARADCAAHPYDLDRKARLEEEAGRLEVLWQEYLAAGARCEGRQKVEDDYNAVKKELVRLDRTLDDCTAGIEAVGFDSDVYAGLGEEREVAEGRHRRYLALAGEAARLPDLQRRRSALASEIHAAEEHLTEALAARGALNFDPDRLAGVRARARSIAEKTQAQREEVSRFKTEMVHLKEREEELKKKLQQVGEIRREIESLEEEEENLKLTRSLLSEYTAYLLGVVRGRLEGVVGEVLGEITDGRYDTVTFDDDFTLMVNDMGADYPAARFSGGEQDDIAIALRIALSRYLAAMRGMGDPAVLIFDEIFGSQDEGRRANLIRALRTQEAHFPQIFLISHIGEVHEEFETTLRVEPGPGPESHIEEVSW
ncbi:DNA repair exonuclease SbcCD ATPase subunit [Methanofollis sp. W23]|uniref:AAA family ATPase n=1 Tax=Methanofollis sp. W23 TaxID=2817849 RepID=UPI001AE9E0B7|nr:SMC family ATPase [Methanofollis sp. W23]MBP2144669.1 DNA repair exonuclease SbcCD ATPase subunit [Methanofollis sp. W23]